MLGLHECRTRWAGLVLPLALALGAATASKAETVTLLADEWCPYNCEPGSDRPGFMVEIAREALAMAGHELDYRNLNWMRSLDKAEKGEVDGVIGAVPEEAPDFIFGPPLGTYLDTVAVRRGEAFDITAPGALDGKTVGAINGYEYVGPVADYIEAHRQDTSLVQFASGNDPLEQNVRKLVAGRVDAIAEVESVLRHKIDELGYADRLEVLTSDDANFIYIAFSPARANSTALAADLKTGVAALRASGRLAEILASYGLEDWE